MIINKTFLKYGYLNFTLKIFKYCNLQILMDREQYYINLLSPKYNINSSTNTRLITKYILEIILKLNLAKKGKNNSLFGLKDENHFNFNKIHSEKTQ